MKQAKQEPPIRNARTIGAFIYSHSGEFAPVYTDLRLRGRGLDLHFVRSYRSSLACHIGELGRGWFGSVVRKLEREGDAIVYRNGAGERYSFHHGKKGEYTPPLGFYGTLSQEEGGFVIRQTFGRTQHFEAPESGGRILSFGDKNQNNIQFSYTARGILIVDTLGRKIALMLRDGLLRELTDHAGREWKYCYDADQRQTNVTRPATAAFPRGTSVQYEYDSEHRLIAVTDAKGQKYLVNHYDSSGRVVVQEHGRGTFKMEYDAADCDEKRSSALRTICIGKDGGKIVLEHDASGRVIGDTVHVRKQAFASQDRERADESHVQLTTRSTYNKHSELSSRVFPGGNKKEWIYSDDDKCPLNHGNLLQTTELPQPGVDTDQERIVSRHEYEAKFQLPKAFIDPRGNKTSYDYDERGNLIVATYPTVTIQPVRSGPEKPATTSKVQKDRYQYNSRGQLLRREHIDGSVSEFRYYPVADWNGTRGPSTASGNAAELCGYLACVVRDANGTKTKNEYAYDLYGNTTTAFDGKGNATHSQYNAMGRVESVTSRAPFKNTIEYQYDANYNEIESTQSFKRFEYDEQSQSTVEIASVLCELREYNTLDNVTQRKIVGGEKVITESFFRDANERVVRQIQPLGNTTEYTYDERDLLIEKKFGVGTKEGFSQHYTFSASDQLRTFTDGNGNTTTHHYDGYQRYRGYTNPAGTKKTQWFDESGNVVRVVVAGQTASAVTESARQLPNEATLMEASYSFDQWNRAYRTDAVWRDASSGRDDLGVSKWNGKKGVVSTVLEYAENGLPGKVWTETDNVVTIGYDGVGRVVTTADTTGENTRFEYDENSNPVATTHTGPELEGRRIERVTRRAYDQLDRLIELRENDEAPERFGYDELGNVATVVAKSGLEVYYTADALGRRVGHAFTIADALDGTKAQRIVRSVEYDDNYRIAARSDAAGKRTVYRYDALDRQTGVVFPDGNRATVEYDNHGNVVREVDQNNAEITSRYDAVNRVVERQSRREGTAKARTEQYEYDGLGRLVASRAPGGAVVRAYDSLSRLLKEQQGDYALRCAHDAAGNLTSLYYPGGAEVHKTYDLRNRVSSVTNNAGEPLASFVYRANDQLASMRLGNELDASYSYNAQERLESVQYTRVDNGALVEGFRCQYDGAGRMTHEIQLSAGATYGERYYYDDAGRATKAQYGVQDVFNPNSSFEEQTSYEHFSEGSWKRRVDTDGLGNVFEEKLGATNELNSYRSFGEHTFDYDGIGNRTGKKKRTGEYCTYAYDQDNRLAKSECYDAQGTKQQTIEYFYNALGQQVRKVVTDKRGVATTYTYVWAGSILLEEYENDVLVRTYFYGVGAVPVQLAVVNTGAAYLPVLNGKGQASGLLPKDSPNAFAETYGYEVTGASFMKEIVGRPVAIPLRNSTHSTVLNGVLSGNSLGIHLKDWHQGTIGISGVQLDPTNGAALNKHGGWRAAMDKQFKQFQSWGGVGGVGSGAGAGHAASALPELNFNAPNTSWYGQGELTPKQKAEQIAAKAEKELNLLLLAVAAGAAGGPIGLLFATGAAVGEAEAAVREHVEALKKIKDDADKKAKDDADKEAADKEAADKEAADKEAADKKAAEKKKAEEEAMPNPDADTTDAIVMFSPRQMEAKLNWNRTPVNPNDDIGPPKIDGSSFTPRSIDPFAYYDGESSVGITGLKAPVPPGGYWTDYADPLDPIRSLNSNAPTSGEGNPNTGKDA